jgi:hydroxyethylthiazole kinase
MTVVSSAFANLSRIRELGPLVVNITNNVVTNTTANALLALGASPAMTHAPADAASLASLSGAVVLNMGTPDEASSASMLAAGAAANRAGVPVAFDPVAAGATPYRQSLAQTLLSQVKMAVVRGNASEILHLAGEDAASKGVDSAHESGAALDGASRLAVRLNCVVCVSGAVDVVTDGAATVRLEGGHPMMTRVTGMGCTATALIGAFLAVAQSPFEATVQAMAVMSCAGAMAADGAAGPGSMQVRFYDALYGLTQGDLEKRMRVL